MARQVLLVHPRESGQEVVQGPGGVNTFALTRSWCGGSRITEFDENREVFRDLLPLQPSQWKNEYENEWMKFLSFMR